MSETTIDSAVEVAESGTTPDAEDETAAEAVRSAR
jgi:hypothetical protein